MNPIEANIASKASSSATSTTAGTPMAVASSNFALAQQHGADADCVSAAIAFSTVASLAKVPWFGWLLSAGGRVLDAAIPAS